MLKKYINDVGGMGRRGPLLFLAMAILITELLTVGSFGSAIRQTGKLLAIALLCIAIVGIMTKDSGKNSSVSGSGNSIIRIFEAVKSDSDASNGRFRLWKLACKSIKQHPIKGIGWRKYNRFRGWWCMAVLSWWSDLSG